jgi:Spondin_N
MKNALLPAMILSAAVPLSAFAQDVSIQLTNLTHGSYFTPLLLATHNKDLDLFEPGMAASTQVQAMAEGGDISGLISIVASAGGSYVDNPAGGLLAPGQMVTSSIPMPIGHKGRLSIVAMILPTNDGFVGLDSLGIPKRPGTYTYYLNAYDAGTEANDEVINGGGTPGVAGIPAAPGGDGGTGATGVTTTESNGHIHIHRGVLGDLDPLAGTSDLDSSVHRWLNPVAKLVLTVAHP